MHLKEGLSSLEKYFELLYIELWDGLGKSKSWSTSPHPPSNPTHLTDMTFEKQRELLCL